MASIVADTELGWGFQLPIQALTAMIRDDWEFDATVADLVEVVRTAEQAGATFVGVCDHVAIPDNDYAANMERTWFDTVATLGFLAAATSTIHLVSSVYIPAYRHPLQTAKSFGTLAHLSGGRVVLGVGAGHVQAEFEALGVDYSARGALLDEAIAAIRAAWADEYSSFDGATWRWSDMAISPRPSGHVPIWIGGSGRAAWRRVAEQGDGWTPMGNPPDQIPEIVEFIHERAAEVGRGDEVFDIGAMTPYMYLGDALPDGLRDIPARHVVGSPDQVIDELSWVTGSGCRTLHVHFRSRSRSELCDQITAFGSDVAPHLAP